MQLNCVRQKLDGLMSELEGIERFRDAKIIIHGDHGSRISIGDTLEDFTPRDFVDNYATFFAVRAPGVNPGVDCDFTSLPQIFRRYVGNHPGLPSTTAAPLPVVVKSRQRRGAAVEAPMPRFGCAAEAR
jgi:hypothetical protein